MCAWLHPALGEHCFEPAANYASKLRQLGTSYYNNSLGGRLDPVSGLLGFSFKSTGGVMRDPFLKFNISTPAKIWWDTPKISTFPTKILAFLRLSGHFSRAVTSGRFDKGRRDA
jgi:hypothetical protein